MKKNNVIIKLSIFIISIIIIMTLIVNIMARYESNTVSVGEIEIALYILNEDYQSMNLNLDNMIPREEPYVHNFSISNYNDIGRTDINLEYTLKIKTTTNLPLIYELYLDQNYTDADAWNIIVEDAVAQDGYGTYFRNIVTSSQRFVHTQDETDIYQLVIYFPEGYNSIQYQDIIENVEIIINSRQAID